MTWHPDIPEEYRNRIVTGDACELAKRLPDGSVDFILIDPPWGIGFKYNNGYEDNPDSYIPMVKWIVNESNRLLKPGAFAFVYQATKRLRETWQYFPENSRLFASCKNFVQIKNLPVEYAVDYIIFWKKQGSTKAQGMVRDWNMANTANTSNGSRGIGFNVATSPPRPLDAVTNIVSQMSPVDGLVLDFFMGSGTTALAAKLTGRRYIGFEIDPDTAELARDRVANTQPPLFTTEPQPEQLELIS